MVKKTDAGLDIINSVAVDVDRDFDIGFFGSSGDCCFAHVRELAFRSQDYVAWPKVYYLIKTAFFIRNDALTPALAR